MGNNERFNSIAITVLSLGAFISLQNLVSCRDLHREIACYRDRLRINCGDRSFIAIHEAFFTTRLLDKSACGPPPIEHEAPLPQLPDLRGPEIDSETTTPSTDGTSECYEDIRVAINKKCSGSGKCEYSYADQGDKKCPNLRGEFSVQYDCVKNVSVSKYCNTRLTHREGYFSSPGFPSFYMQLSDCAWTVSSAPGQTVLLKVLQLHLRPPTEVVPTVADPDSMFSPFILGHMVSEEDSARCESDALTILESGRRLASLCGESEAGLRTFEVDSGQVEVTFKSSAFMPASGFLIYYKVQGCPTLTSADGSSRLVEDRSNGSVAFFACTKPFRVFNDTLEPERALSCVRDHHWNDTLPPCIALEVVTTTPLGATENTGPAHLAYENGTLPTPERTTAQVKEAAYLEDIIIPSALIGGLVIVNAVIVATILIIRKRNKSKMDLEAETLEDPKAEPLVADINDL